MVLAGCGRGQESTSAVTPAEIEAPAEIGMASTATRPVVDAALAAPTYAKQCASCHGTSGRGDGPLVGGLPIKPRSFASDEWRFVDFSAGDEAVNAAIAQVLHQGIPDAMMPSYAKTLSEEQILELVAYVLELRQQGRGG